MTSIEWLINALMEWKDDDPMYRGVQCGIFEDAKERHKQEIEKAFEYGVTEGALTDINYLKCTEEAEQYYKETFKKD